MSETIFSRIIAGKLPAERLYEDQHCIVIRDKFPQAPLHLLIIPRKPLARLVDATDEDRELLGHLLLVAGKMAHQSGVAEGCRIVINNGAGGGQTVFHLHLHLLAGNFSESDTGK